MDLWHSNDRRLKFFSLVRDISRFMVSVGFLHFGYPYQGISWSRSFVRCGDPGGSIRMYSLEDCKQIDRV